MSDFLMHHGILGQKWGVRRYQNKDGSLTAEGKARYSRDTIQLPSSTVYHRITSNSDPTIGQGAYVSYQPSDAEVFRGLFGMKSVQNLEKEHPEVYEITFKSKKPLKIPSKEARLSTFKEFISNKDNKKDVENELKKQGTLRKVDLEHLESGKNLDKAYLYFNESLGRGVESDPVNQRYYDFMKKKGYSAIVDENDVRLSKSVRTNAPLIIIDPSDIDTNVRVKSLSAGDIVPYAKKNLLDQSLKIIRGYNKEYLDPVKQQTDNAVNTFSEQYTLNDLKKDRYINNLSFKKIEAINKQMVANNITREEAISKLGYNVKM